MSFMKRFPIYVGLFLFAYLLLVQGCSENIPFPTKHSFKPAAEFELQPLRRLQSIRMKPAEFDDEWECVTKLIKAKKGGRVKLDRNSVRIPKHALTEDKPISISVNEDLVICDFGPDGTVFEKPVKITISYEDADLEGVDEDAISVYWWDPDNCCWEELESKVNKKKKTVSAEIWHFSRYALI
jgi:hypothetical protein